MGLASLALAVPAADPDKIGQWIKARQFAKERLASASPAERGAIESAWGIRADELGAERVALYVHERLTPAEMDELASRGIAVNRRLFIPPVPGRHPHGFHLARVPREEFDFIRRDARFVRAASVELRGHPNNDVAAEVIGVDVLHAGTGGVGPYDGTGVRVAVADSGLDPGNTDLPALVEGFDVTDGDGPPGDPDTSTPWTTNVAGMVDTHGTHVSGIVLGRGTYSGGVYKGMAPGAELCFYKIGNDTNASTTAEDVIEAVERASAMDCRVFNLSYGAPSSFLDGSDPVEQAIDAAFAQGMLSVISAGNLRGDDLVHAEEVAPGASSPTFGLRISNSSSTSAFTTFLPLAVLWRDGNAGDLNVELSVDNLGAGESLVFLGEDFSSRGTEGRLYALVPNIPPSQFKIYNVQLTNTAASGQTPRYFAAAIAFQYPARFLEGTDDTIVGSPAVADTAIAVAAWVHRESWVNYQGSLRDFGQTQDTIATFSSFGPRIDGALKPNILAPGSATISARSSLVSVNTTVLISDDGSTNGQGMTHYAALHGTSMSSPTCAGAAALLFQANPQATAAQVREALLSTASQADNPDTMVGHGMVNASAAVQAILSAQSSTGSGWVIRGEE
jgi:minor extracellular serine protease Vpr